MDEKIVVSTTEVESKFNKEQRGHLIVNEVIRIKEKIDSSINHNAEAVKNILDSLEVGVSDSPETHTEKELPNPEETINKIKKDYSLIYQPSIDEISEFVINSGLGLRDIQTWLRENQSKVQSLSTTREELEKRKSDLTHQLSVENNKNFFSKLLNKKKRVTLRQSINDVNRQTSQINVSLQSQGFDTAEIESDLQELLLLRYDLAINASKQLFMDVVSGNKQLQESLLSSEVKKELNESLIAEIVLPKLDMLQAQANNGINQEIAKEYVEILKVELSEGSKHSWRDPIDKQESVEKRMKRLEELSLKSGYNLRDIGKLVSCQEHRLADNYYNKIFELLITENTKDQVEQLCDILCRSLKPELQEIITEVAQDIINPSPNFREPIYYDPIGFDTSLSSTDDLKNLDGLERWRIVKKFVESSGVIPNRVFVQAERTIINELFVKQLSANHVESWQLSASVIKIKELNNPEALLPFLHFIETTNISHTSNLIVEVMEELLKKSNSTDLQLVMDSLPRNKRIILETLADQDSYLNRFGKYFPSFPALLLQNGDHTITLELFTKILEDSGKFSQEKLLNFYLWQAQDGSEISDYILEARSKFEKAIIESKLSTWIQSADKVLSALISPRNGESIVFPRRIVKEGLGITDEKSLTILNQIFESKTFKSSGFERETFLDGLILLNSKENGKTVLETLFAAYRGTNNDPSRIRRIFQMLITMNAFGEYDFVLPNQVTIEETNQEIKKLEGQPQPISDKSKNKSKKNQIDTLKIKYQNMTGLKGIEDTMTQRVVEIACRKLNLPDTYQEKIKNKIDDILNGDLLEIVPSLLGKYQSRNETEVKDLLSKITSHIIEGDFKTWRYAHQLSEVQLAGLTEEQKKFWIKTLEPVTIDVELSDDESLKREGELKLIQEIVRNAKEHILETQPNFDFSNERLNVLNSKIGQITQQIKSVTSEDDKKRLIVEKRALEAEATLTKGFLEIEKVTPRSFAKNTILAQAREIREIIAELNLPLAGLDIEQIEKIFTVGDIKRVSAYESDDALTLLKVGIEPQETCQSWRNGVYNECLLAYVADSNIKLVNVVGGDSRIVARTIIKLIKQRETNDFQSKTQRNTLLIEKPYSLVLNNQVYSAFFQLILTKARGLNSSITFKKDFFDESILKMFENEARTLGYKMSETSLDLYIPKSSNKYVYSDTFGGKISSFDTYQQNDVITFEPIT